MDPLKNPFGRPPPPPQPRPAGPPYPSNGIHHYPQPGFSQPPMAPVYMGPIDPIGILLKKMKQMPRRTIPPEDPAMAALQTRIESTFVYCPRGTSMGPLCLPSTSLANFLLPQPHADLSQEPRIFAESYRFADDSAWCIKENIDENDEEKKFEPLFGSCKPAKIPTIDLEMAFQKEIIHLGKVEKNRLRGNLLNHRELIFRFLGDVTDLRSRGNGEYKDRVAAINDHISQRVVKFHPLYDLNQSPDILPKEDLKYLEENDLHLYRIMHRIFAPNMSSLKQPEYKAFGQIVEDETYRIKCRKLRVQMEEVLGDFQNLTISTGDKEKGQEIQQAVMEGLAGEVEPETFERIFVDDVLPIEQLGAAFRRMELPAKEPEVQKDDLDAEKETITPEQRRELEELYIPEKEFAAFRLSEKVKNDRVHPQEQGVPAYPGSMETEMVPATAAQPEPEYVPMEEEYSETTPVAAAVQTPAVQPLLDFEEMYPEGVPMDQEYPGTTEQEILQARRDSGYDDLEPEIIMEQPAVKGILKKTCCFYASDLDNYNISTQDRLAYAAFYVEQKKKTVRFKEAYDYQVRIFRHNDPHLLIRECWETVEAAKNIDEYLFYPVDYFEKKNKREFKSSHFPWTVACEVDYRIYRTKFSPEDRRTAHSNLKDGFEEEAKEWPGRRVCLSSRLRRVAFRFDDPLLKTHILPAHEGKREKNPATIPKEHKTMAAYLLEQYKKLIRYSDYWQPIRETTLRDCENAYNHCYGPMIISDSLMEEAEPRYLQNAGLFAFPPPLGVREISELLETITVREFGIRDIILIWGLDVLLHKEPEVAVAKLFSLSQFLRKILEDKMIVYHKQGYHRTELPTFWVTTLPVSPTIDSGMERFNKMIKQVAEICGVSVIDWAGEFARQVGAVTERNAETQLEVLYDLLQEKVNISPYRSPNRCHWDRHTGKEYINSWEFMQEQRRIRQELEKQKEEMKRKNEPVKELKPPVRIRTRIE